MTHNEVMSKSNAVQNEKPEVNGAIAQLGERLPCTQEVSGSIPLSSTNFTLLEFVYSLTYTSRLCEKTNPTRPKNISI